MATFLFAYRAPTNYTPGSPETVAAWTSWFEGMGTNMLASRSANLRRRRRRPVDQPTLPAPARNNDHQQEDS
jgi:hypothetical protein